MTDERSQTTKVRVRLAIAPSGKWFCYGYSGCSDDDADSVLFDMATDEPTIVFKYLVAEVEVPQTQEVVANAEG